MELLGSYILVVGGVYAAMLGLYFGFGLLAEVYLRRCPERKIQPGRDGLKRKSKEILASLRALATSSVLFGTGWFAQMQGWTPSPELSVFSFVVYLAAVVILFDAWFYFGHRLLHWKPMYQFHAEHHKSVAPTVWSNDSSGVVDTIVQHSFYLLIWFVLPVPALSMIALRVYDQISGMIGHSGFELFASPTTRRPWPFICTTFHDLHHSRYNYNYGNLFSIWDRLCGTAHPDYDEMVQTFEKPS